MYIPICEVWECPFPHNLANTWFDQSFKFWPTHEIRVFQYLHLYFPSHQAFRSHFIALLNGGCAPLCCCPLPSRCHHRQPGCLLKLQVKSQFQSLCAQGHTASSLRKSPGWVRCQLTPSCSVIGALGAHPAWIGLGDWREHPGSCKSPFPPGLDLMTWMTPFVLVWAWPTSGGWMEHWGEDKGPALYKAEGRRGSSSTLYLPSVTLLASALEL